MSSNPQDLFSGAMPTGDPSVNPGANTKMGAGAVASIIKVPFRQTEQLHACIDRGKLSVRRASVAVRHRSTEIVQNDRGRQAKVACIGNPASNRGRC